MGPGPSRDNDGLSLSTGNYCEYDDYKTASFAWHSAILRSTDGSK